MKPLKVYKIQNKEGLFSKGGRWPMFTKTGKTWSNIGHLKTHLMQFTTFPKQYQGCEIVEIEYKPVEGSKIPIDSFYKEASKNHQINDLKQRISNMEYNLPRYEQQKDQWVEYYKEELKQFKIKLKALTEG